MHRTLRKHLKDLAAAAADLEALLAAAGPDSLEDLETARALVKTAELQDKLGKLAGRLKKATARPAAAG